MFPSNEFLIRGLSTAIDLISLPARSARTSLRLARRSFAALSSPVERHRRGPCVVCGAPVIEGEPFLRYRGEYYHADDCLESNPPALSRLRGLGTGHAV